MITELPPVVLPALDPANVEPVAPATAEQLEELRGKMRALGHTEAAIVRVHCLYHREIAWLEDLTAAEVFDWCNVLDWNIRRDPEVLR